MARESPTVRHAIRPQWLGRVVDASQVLAGAIESQRISLVRDGLRQFEAAGGAPRTAAERLILRGLTLELYLLAERRFERWVPHTVHAAARTELCAPQEHGIRRLTWALNALLTAVSASWAAAPHEQARRWIDENPGAKLSVDQLASELHVHSRTLRRHFAREVGVPIHEYHCRRRAEYLLQLLAERREKIAAIATLAGVNSRSTFYRLVRRCRTR